MCDVINGRPLKPVFTMFSDVMEGHSSHILTETDQAVEGTKRSHRVTIYETF